MLKWIAGLMAALACWGAVAAAEEPAEDATDWHAAAASDLQAAYALVRDNHPAMRPEMADPAFPQRLEASHGRALAMAEKVHDYPGYAAAMRAFVNGLGDKHLWWRPKDPPPVEYGWPGVVVARRGSAWEVTAQAERPPGAPDLMGARLVSCDGRTADALAEERLGGFRAVWSIEAQRIASGPFLLVDDGNPFLSLPRHCRFETANGPADVSMGWRPIERPALQVHLKDALKTGSAGFGVRKFAGGWWISMESLDERVPAVIRAVHGDIAAIRAAPLVVIDMRGNGGGDSSYGRQLIGELLGPDAVRQLQRGGGAGCGNYWRATPGNLEGLRAFLREKGPTLGAETAAWLKGVEADIAGAVAKGQPFDIPFKACKETGAPRGPVKLKANPMKGRLILLTDHACFSSCLLVTDDLRRLGAIHAGEATDAATRYMEVREVLLPSGRGYSSTLQKAAMAAPPQIGPYSPDWVFEGDISDTAELEAWLASAVR